MDVLPILLSVFLTVSILYNVFLLWRAKQPNAQNIRLEEQLNQKTWQCTTTQTQQKAAEEKIFTLERSVATLESEKKGLEAKIGEHKSDLQKTQEQFVLQFENLSQKIFAEQTSKLKTDSEKSLKDLLDPFKERLTTLQTKVETFYGNESKERASLKTEIQNIVAANQQITKEAHNLTQALKGDSKTQGNWGELVLATLLEDSGLREGSEYTLQGKNLDLITEDGQRLKPDVIVHLPEGKHIVIDSKVSLTHFEQLVSATDVLEKEQSLQKFIASIYAHIDGLSGKKYHHLEQLVSPELTLMFLPLEGAFATALQKEPDFYNYAWSKSILIVSPTTLLATLRTIESLWKRERQNKNAMEIARLAGGLYDKFTLFITDLENIGLSLKKSRDIYDDACNKLYSGQGNLISRVETLKKLGAKASKSLPEKYLLEETFDEPARFAEPS